MEGLPLDPEADIENREWKLNVEYSFQSTIDKGGADESESIRKIAG
jgi:hypothetical protein